MELPASKHAAEWVEISHLCREASVCLQMQSVRPMLACPGFSLHESMNAVELMDKQMDQCAGLNLHTRFFDQTFDVQAVSAQLTDEQLSASLAVLVVLMVQFLRGASLLDSTHTCPLPWERALRGLLVARETAGVSLVRETTLLCAGALIVRAQQATFSSLLSVDIYEEEDFNPAHRQFLSDAERILPTTLPPYPITLSAPLRSLLDVFSSLASLLGALSDCISLCVRGEEAIASQLNLLGEQLTLVKESAAAVQVAVATAGREVGEVMSDGNPLFQPALSRVHQAGPVRALQPLSFPAALSYLASFCSELDGVSGQLLLLKGSAASPSSFSTVFSYVLAQGQAHVLTRSLLLSALHMQLPLLSGGVCLALRDWGVSAPVLSHPLLADWLERGVAGAALWETLRALLASRSRALGRLEQALPLLSQAWGEARLVEERLDGSLAVALEAAADTVPCSISSYFSWVVAQVMRLCLSLQYRQGVLDLGVEAGCFFWYLDFSLALQIRNEDGARKNKVEQALASRSPQRASQLLQFSTEELVVRAHSQLARGIFREHVLLGRLGLLPQRNPRLMWRLFTMRFRPFADLLHPTALQLEDFEACLTAQEDNVETRRLLLANSVACFQNARQLLEQARKAPEDSSRSLTQDEVKSLLRVCVASSL
eukprot:gene29863-36056_t